MKKFFLGIFFIIVIGLELASASFTLYNSSIEEMYAPGAALSGWINLSLDDEDSDSLLTGFEGEIEILEFLENNELFSEDDFSCLPFDCLTNYDSSNYQTSKSYSLKGGDKKLIGIKISGSIDEVTGFSMNVESNAAESGYPQIFFNFLDNRDIEWQSNNFSGNFGEEIYDCYEEGSVTGNAEITETEYCQKINIPPASRLRIGADVVEVPGKGGNVDFQMRAYNDDENEVCIATASGTGEIACEVDIVNNKFVDFFVCISTEDYDDDNKYSINYEQDDPCGFSEYGEEESYDFAIFASPGKYSRLGSFVLDEQKVEDHSRVYLLEYLEDYVYSKYKNNCSKGCIIPIEIISGVNQNLVISNLGLSYKNSDGLSTTENNIYDLSETPATISMESKILYLEKSEISVPSSYGNKTLSLKLDGDEIVERRIEVLKSGTIGEIFPLVTCAGVPTVFTVSASGNISKYKWEFSDGENVTTTENYTSHTFSQTGTYSLKVTITSSGVSLSKQVDISIVSPSAEINKTLEEKKEALENLTSFINGISGWYKVELESAIDIESRESELLDLTERYENATEEEYVGILTDIYELKIPSEIEKVDFDGVFLPSEVDPSYLIEFGYYSDDPYQYSDQIISWMVANINLNLESTIFYGKYPDKKEPIFTFIKLKVDPKESVEEAYLIIKEQGIIFKEDYGQTESGGATGIELIDLESERTIEFIFPIGVEAIDLPLYISPDFSELPEDIVVGPCDNNGECDGDEDEDNCPNDCHKAPLGKIMMWIFILLAVAFVIYIILQEWYKRRYESHLFKEKGELYNLMSFMDNALRRGLSKDKVYEMLKKYKWKSEQITYTFKKLFGKRTGMWEIPIFNVFEKKKVQKELAKRRQFGNPGLQKI